MAFVGIDCHFTQCVLADLLSAGVNITGMIMPGPPGVEQPVAVYRERTSIPLADQSNTNRGIVGLLEDYQVPAFRLGNLGSAAATQTVLSFAADVMLCACFPSLIPSRLTDLFLLGALNVHPSLLPDKRGPDPLFWTFREGSGRSGVTIHELSPRFDAGPILAQRAATYADGTTENDLERSLASHASRMAIELLPSLIENPPRTLQDESLASYAPWPQHPDFQLDATMTARAAFNFTRGIQARNVPITASFQGVSVVVAEAIRFASDIASVDEGATPLEFADGYLIARVEWDD